MTSLACFMLDTRTRLHEPIQPQWLLFPYDILEYVLTIIIGLTNSFCAAATSQTNR